MASISCFVNTSVHCGSEVVLTTSYICTGLWQDKQWPNEWLEQLLLRSNFGSIFRILEVKKVPISGHFVGLLIVLLLGFCFLEDTNLWGFRAHIIRPSFKEQCPVETDGKDSVQLQEAMKSHKVFSHQKWFMTFYDWWVSDWRMIIQCATMVSQSVVFCRFYLCFWMLRHLPVHQVAPNHMTHQRLTSSQLQVDRFGQAICEAFIADRRRKLIRTFLVGNGVTNCCEN